jgi:hypothetical protein
LPDPAFAPLLRRNSASGFTSPHCTHLFASARRALCSSCVGIPFFCHPSPAPFSVLRIPRTVTAAQIKELSSAISSIQPHCGTNKGTEFRYFANLPPLQPNKGTVFRYFVNLPPLQSNKGTAFRYFVNLPPLQSNKGTVFRYFANSAPLRLNKGTVFRYFSHY